MRFGSWKVTSLCRPGSPTTAARELARYKLDLVGVQEVSWDKWGTVRATDCVFVYGKLNENNRLKQEFLYTAEYYQQLSE